MLATELGQPRRVLDHNSLTVEGPIEDTDAGGRTWFVYLGTAITQHLRPINATPLAPTDTSIAAD